MGALTKHKIDAATDSIKISDGTDTLAINASGEALVKDTDATALLTTIDADTSSIATDASTIAGDTTSIDAILTALTKAEDSVHVSGDQGIMGLAVQTAAEGPLAADGDYAPLQVDPSGRLRIIGDLDVVGNVADDDVDSGNPLKVGMRGVAQSSVLTALSAGNDRADMLSDLYRRQFINTGPNVGLKATQVSVDTTIGGTNLTPTPQAGRMFMDIRNSVQDMFLGATGVTTATGFLLEEDESLTIELGEGVDIFGITASGAATVYVLERG